MIPLRFFRDKTHVYINNPDGTTKKMSIADFEAMLNGGGGDIPEHSSANQGEVLSVDADGDLVWRTLPPPSSGGMVVTITADEITGYATADKTFTEILTALSSGKNVVFYWGGVYSSLIAIVSDDLLIYVDTSNTAHFYPNADGYPSMELGGD